MAAMLSQIISSQQIIIREIRAHIQVCGGTYSEWYVGITSDIKQRLFDYHNVDRSRDSYIYRDANSPAIARAIEKYFINTLGTDGGDGGGNNSTTQVYAFKQTSITRR